MASKEKKVSPIMRAPPHSRLLPRGLPAFSVFTHKRRTIDTLTLQLESLATMLLTSTQVSVALSTGVVVVFTALLFVAGCVLQQRTVRNLQAEIKPRLPTALVVQEAPQVMTAVAFGIAPDTRYENLAPDGAQLVVQLRTEGSAGREEKVVAQESISEEV